MLQTSIVIIVVAAAALWLGRRWWRQLKSDSPSCGCGGCDGCQPPAGNQMNLQQYEPKDKSCGCK